MMKKNSDSSSSCTCDENDYSDSELITVILNTFTSESLVHSMSSYPDKILTTIKINDKRNIQMKVDTGADTCVLHGVATDNLKSNLVAVYLLKGYGGNPINNLGATNLRVTFKNKSISTKFNIVKAPGHPSMMKCQQAQELGIITLKSFPVHNCNPQQNKLSIKVVCPNKTIVLTEYKDCFDKIG